MNKYIGDLIKGGWFKKSDSDNRLILLHGSLAHIFDKDQAPSQIPADRFIGEISARSSALLLLGAPYISSFVHETIHLSGKDMERAELYALPFKQTSDAPGIISSIALNKKRALTVHSRFSSKGVELLDSLKALKIKVSWRPAILTLIQNLFSFSPDVLRQKDYLTIYLQEEALRARWNGSFLEFQTFHYWRPELEFDLKKRYMETLLSDDQAERTESAVVFNRLDNISDDQASLIDNLLRPRRRKIKPRISQRVLKKKKWGNFNGKITLNRVLVGLSAVFAVWALVVNLNLFKAEREYLDAQKNLSRLRERSKSFKQIAEVERAYFRLSSFWETAEELKARPDLILSKLDDIMSPSEVWIQRVSINFNKIVLDLLGNKKTDLRRLIESLNRRLGKTSLEKSEAAPFEKPGLKKYRLIIDYSNANINNEKMDRK